MVVEVTDEEILSDDLVRDALLLFNESVELVNSRFSLQNFVSIGYRYDKFELTLAIRAVLYFFLES